MIILQEVFTGVTAPLYNDLIKRGQNILIAGMTGSGKSVIMNGIINSILYRSLEEHQMVLIDPKIVEFSRYSKTNHCIKCATDLKEIDRTLDGVLNLTHRRFKYMLENDLVLYNGTTVHLLIDEMADLMLTNKSAVNKLQRICQIGRAANIQVIAATQCPLASVIPTKIKVNFPIIIGLHTASAKHSRNILEVNGCEDLPMYGEALIRYPTTGLTKVKVPKIPDEWLEKIIKADIEG